jgi:predicted regulator of Ras-like GTPase activity (Roadblock/LC7/MglB family)
MDKNGVIGAMIIDSDGLCLACKYQISKPSHHIHLNKIIHTLINT